MRCIDTPVSVREVAVIGHALVHRHSDTRENIVREALECVHERMSLRWKHLANAGNVTRILIGRSATYRRALLALNGAVMDGLTDGASSRLVNG